MIWYVVVFINSLEKYVNTSMCQTLCWELETQRFMRPQSLKELSIWVGKKGNKNRYQIGQSTWCPGRYVP